MAKNIIKADKKHRTNVLGFVIIMAVAGIAVIEWLIPAGTEYILKLENSEQAFTIIETVLTFLFLCIIPFVFYLFSLGRRIVDREQFPLPGTKVIRDTSRIQGQKAVLRGQMMVFISILLIFLALIGWIFIHYAVQSLSGK